MRLYSTAQIATAIELTLISIQKSGKDIQEIGKVEEIFTNFYREQLLTLIPAAED